MMRWAVFCILGILGSSTLWAKTFELDEAHTTIGFRIKHLMISTVQGRFDQFKGTIEIDDKTGALTAVHSIVQAKSINTNEPDRDKHLRSPDFFDATTKGHETIKFISDPFTIKKGESGKMPGKLTIRGVTRPVIWDVSYGGTIKDAWGNEKAALDATLTVNRKDYDLKWNKAIEAGGVLVGDDVKIEVNGEGKEKEEPQEETSAKK
ncbi:MAG: YceI family protein [Bacteriovoracia bacterium]